MEFFLYVLVNGRFYQQKTVIIKYTTCIFWVCFYITCYCFFVSMFNLNNLFIYVMILKHFDHILFVIQLIKFSRVLSRLKFLL